MKNINYISFLLIFLLPISLVGCVAYNDRPHSTTRYGTFDTFSTVQSYAQDNESEFKQNSAQIYELLEYYHKQFDIYNEYEGINNLCTVNKNAGKSSVVVETELIDFLEYSIALCKKCNLEVNIAMGSVLSLWHNARTDALNGNDVHIPSESELKEAYTHADINSIVINREESTVFITDEKTRIDVGSIGKGYAVMMATNLLRQSGNGDGYVINVGGNISAIGTKPNREGWITGITNPDKNSKEPFAAKVKIFDTSCVTSGNYERFFEYESKLYHHIIDKDTLYPAEYFSSVTVICRDSGLADALSTALFCMSIQDGKNILAQFDGVEALWITLDGVVEKTEGFDVIA